MNVELKDKGKRADVYVMESLHTNNITAPSRSFLQHNWEDLVLIDHKRQKYSLKLKEGQTVEIFDEKFNVILVAKNYDEVISQDGKLDVVLEDKDFLVVNKQKGIPMHPGVGNTQDTLANYVRGYLESKGEYDARVDRAGVIHRLDKPVSGLVVFAKTLESQKYIQKQFEEHSVNKIYLAKVVSKGNQNSPLLENVNESDLKSPKEEVDSLIEKNFEIDESWRKESGFVGRSRLNRKKTIFKKVFFGGSRAALTYLKPLKDGQVLVVIKTGRMYQIRATLESMGMYVEGDTMFETLKGGASAESIALESVLLGFQSISGKAILARLI